MSKVIQSPVKRWPGSVTIADPFTLSQAMLVEQALGKPEADEDGRTWLTAYDGLKLPAVMGCVEKWDLQNFVFAADGSFPASPRNATHHLVDWIFQELVTIYIGELDAPNE